MIFTTKMMKERLRNSRDPAGKIMRMVQGGELFPLTRGLYETEADVPGEALAGAICGPSYLSFDYALSYYGLIPEGVVAFTSATVGKRKTKMYENRYGRYLYRDVPAEVYPLGVRLLENAGHFYLMATPEKALCDKLRTVAPVRSVRDLKTLLFEDLRIDETAFSQLNFQDIAALCERERSANLRYLHKIAGRKKTWTAFSGR